MSLDALTKQLGIYSGVVSIEEQEINIELNIESDEDGVPLDTTASPEAEMLDAGEDEAALDETTDAQEDLEEAHDALEALAISIEQYRLSGGMSPAIAEEKYKQLDLITGKWGSLRSTVPSVESFGLESSQMSAIISLENAAWEAVKRFWETIVKTVTGWIDSFKGWVSKMLNAGTRLKKRAEAIKKDLGKFENTPAKPAEGRLAQAVYTTDSGKLAEDFAKLKTYSAIVLGECVNKYGTFSSSDGDGTLKAAEIAAKNTSASTGNFDLSGMSKIFTAYFNVVKSSSQIAGGKAGLTYRTTEILPGAKKFCIGIPDISRVTFSSDVDGIGKAKAWVNSIDSKWEVAVSKDSLSKKTVQWLDAAGAASVCDTAIAIASDIEKYKSEWKIREDAGKKITEFAKANVNGVFKQATESIKGEGKNNHLVKGNVAIAQILFSKLSNIDKNFISGTIGIVNSVLNFALASSKAHDKKPAEEATT